MVVKGLNLRGVTEFCRVWVRQPELLLPQLSVRDLNEVSFQSLRDRGFKGVVFDKDNTLTIPHHHEIAPHLQRSFEECKRVFGDNVLIFSNSAGSNDDPGFAKAAQIEKELQVAVLRHNQKARLMKPNGIEHVKAYFGVEPEQLIMIGDRYSTDILFGNMHGFLTIRTDQFTQDGESVVNKQMQRIEKALIERIVESGVEPRPHPLMSTEGGQINSRYSASSPPVE
ncbi:hypothetical protein Poli38472_000678 [Pythium oligandrum]|uniref:Uncharacterized protein n=1 Tax=Pythium oligandrum TaxID=41045 RepID=A0A8K1CC58_PYTOL|nr:hypothetical protein Poli38472_000678 [Pythium oligandrum]|eukprot:TMW60636.1 hypothetical protein Poli38472_000678 [Pythium oligandrum]